MNYFFVTSVRKVTIRYFSALIVFNSGFPLLKLGINLTTPDYTFSTAFSFENTWFDWLSIILSLCATLVYIKYIGYEKYLIEKADGTVNQVAAMAGRTSSEIVTDLIPKLATCIDTLHVNTAVDILVTLREKIANTRFLDYALLSKVDFLKGKCKRFVKMAECNELFKLSYEEIEKAGKFDKDAYTGRIIAACAEKDKDTALALSKELKERVQSFLSHDASERSLSVFLCCQYPNIYMPYKESYYVALCEYLGIKKCTKVGEKYLHYMEIMAPLVAIIKKDEAIHKLLSKDIGKYPSNDLLIAQDIVYTIFERHLINFKKMKEIFEWIPFYKELAQKLLDFKDNPSKLASVIYESFDRDKEIKFLHDGDGSDFDEIDPFTVFSIINRVMKNRVDMIKKMKEVFDISAKAPDSFEGIPTQNPINASFCCFSKDRSEDGKDIERLWNLFEKALQGDENMEEYFNAVLKQKSVAIPKLTMGLFYVNPYSYLSLDGNNRRYLEEYGVSTKIFQKMKYADYIELLEKVKDKMEKKEIAEQTFPEFSANAYSLEGMGDDDGTDESYYQEIAELLRFKKNIIIEGAPGVGKTYELPRIITRLCFPELGSIPNAVLSTKFQQLKEVEYVTFHQSMDYEEFVEGIRPQTDDDGNVIYKTEDGIFKQICEEAMKPIVEENKLNIRGDATVWKVSLAGTGDNPVRTDCMKNGHIRIGWDSLGEDLSQVQESRYEGKIILDAFYDKMNIGDIVFSCYSSRTIDAIGVIVGDVEWHDEYEHYKRLRKVEWLLKGINENIYELNGQTSMTLGTVYRLNNITLDKVFGILNSYGVSNPTEAKKNNRPYVLVIDEINRGNVSKIFGELITLIEPDKRAGKASEIKARLPYSKKPFVVPDNLYIIGTMNTADRSLDTLDYAMRRRFAFVKFKPTVINVEGFNEELFAMVSKLFISNYDEYCENADVILQSSEYLADDIQPSDVWIGHSYFLMYDEEGNDKTQLRIQYEIIPILEEYIKDGVFKDITEVNNVMEALINYTDAT